MYEEVYLRVHPDSRGVLLFVMGGGAYAHRPLMTDDAGTVTKEIKPFVFHANLGYTWIGVSEEDDVFNYSLAGLTDANPDYIVTTGLTHEF